MTKIISHMIISFVALLIIVSGSGIASTVSADPISTPGPPVSEITPGRTPTPVDTFCDIMIQCDIFVYDEPQGQSVPISGALIEPVSAMCPYESWTTGSGGWTTLIYGNYNFDMDIRVSKSGYYESECNIDYSSCPAYIGLSPMTTATPEPTPTPRPPCDGDVNQDNELTSEDAQLAFFIVLGLMSPDYQQYAAADCDGSGVVTSADAQEIFIAVMQSGSCVDPLNYLFE